MLESLTIDGVRGIDHLHLDGLSLVNVIAGDNGTGKTTILEATVLLFGASPGGLRLIQSNRGIPVSRVTRFPTVPKHVSESLFFGFSDVGTATIKGVRSGKRWLTRLRAENVDVVDEEWEEDLDDDEEDQTTVLRIDTSLDDRPLSEETPRQDLVKSDLLATDDRLPGRDDVNTLGDLRISPSRKALGNVISSLQTIRSDITDVEYIQSSVGTGFYVSLEQGKRVPLGALGGGANALFRYLLALQKVAGGVLAIDEVEGGFHYKRVEAVFKALLVAARLTNTQIFCTTHSKEVLAALVEAAAETPENDLSVISTYRDREGKIAAQVLRERDALDSLELGYELR